MTDLEIKQLVKERAKQYHECLIKQNPQTEAYGFDMAFYDGAIWMYKNIMNGLINGQKSN